MNDILSSISSSVRDRGWHSAQKETHEVASISFDDIIEAINPLNHIPFATRLQDNPVSPVVKMIAGTIIGGPLGFATAAVNEVFEEANGKGVLSSVVHATLQPEERTMEQLASERYQSIANRHKRHFHTWSA